VRYQVHIDTYECNSCGSCVALLPELFCLNDLSGKAELTDNREYTADKLAQAQAYCPSHCIAVAEDGD